MNNDLVVIEEEKLLKAFSDYNGLDPVIQQAREVVETFEHDLSTDSGRKRTASLAHKVAKLKTRLDGMGKGLVSDWKAKSNIVDKSRRLMRKELDFLKETARKPLDDWEKEQERITAEEAERLAEEKLEAEIEQDHEIGLLMDNEITRIREEEARAKIEEERIARELEAKESLERDARIVDEARQKAEEAARVEIERIEQEKQELFARHVESERRRIAAKERAKIQAEEVEKRRIEEKKVAILGAKMAAEMARQEERLRIDAEEEAKAEALRKREENKRHVGSVRRKAKEGLIALGVREPLAKTIVMAIHNKDIFAVSISY